MTSVAAWGSSSRIENTRLEITQSSDPVFDSRRLVTRLIIFPSPDCRKVRQTTGHKTFFVLAKVLGLVFLLISCGFYSAIPSVAVITVTQVLVWLTTSTLIICFLAHAEATGCYCTPAFLHEALGRVRSIMQRAWDLNFGGSALNKEVDIQGEKPFQSLPFIWISTIATFFLFSAALTLFLALLTLQPTRKPNLWIVGFPAAIIGLYTLLGLLLWTLSLPCLLKRLHCSSLAPGPLLLAIVGIVYFIAFQFIVETPITHLVAWTAFIFALSTSIALTSTFSTKLSMQRPSKCAKNITIFGLLTSLGIATGLALYFSISYLGNSVLLDERYQPFLLQYSQTLADSFNITAADPTQRGSWEYKQLTFGPRTGGSYIKYNSNDPGSILTDTMDVSGIIPAHPYGGFSRFHKWYWGYSEANLPVAGRIYLPTTGGGVDPRPAFLMIHGNAFPKIRSEDGYSELMELLASHGIIAVTIAVEQMNWGLFEFLDKLFGSLMIEYDYTYRALLGLQALDYLRAWNKTSAMLDFYGRVQNNFVIAGHSRGGQAAVTAAYLNSMKTFKAPTGKTVTLGYGFNVAGIYLVAPVFVNTTAVPHIPGHAVPVRNVSVLMQQGSMDADTGVVGFPHYEAAQLRPGEFKAVITLHGANHNQFNRLWGVNMDGLTMTGSPKNWLFNRDHLLHRLDQYDANIFYGTAFALATLYPEAANSAQYLELIRSSESALVYHHSHRWLTATEVRSVYLSGSARVLANFDDDNQLQTCSIPRCMLRTTGFDSWEEVFSPLYPELSSWNLYYHGSRLLRLGLAKRKNGGTNIRGEGCFTIEFQSEQLLQTSKNASVLSFSAVEDISSPNILKDYLSHPSPHYLNVSLHLTYGWTPRNASVALPVSEAVRLLKTDPVRHVNLLKTFRLDFNKDLGVEDPSSVRGVSLCMGQPIHRDSIVMIDDISLDGQ